MTNMLQVCSNFRRARLFIIHTRQDEILCVKRPWEEFVLHNLRILVCLVIYDSG